ncbi:MAG: peptide ligase PGM1-related protein [Actinomycetes bacterium]
MQSFPELQARLGVACAANKPGSGVPHVLVALPSFSVGESLLSHYADRIPALEHRYLVAQLMLYRITDCEMVFVCTQAPDDAVLEYYLGLVPPDQRDSVRSRFRVLVVPDPSHRPVAAKLLDRPDLLDDLAASFAGRPAFIEPWNVTADEVDVAVALGVPVNGTAPALWPLGFKSAGRRLMRSAGVPVPHGVEDVRTVHEVAAAARAVAAARPGTTGVVVKLDDSGAGDGNLVVELDAGSDTSLEQRLASTPPWYREALLAGGVVEQLVTGATFSTPSVQADISPDGGVSVLATHEQVVGGPSGQVYLGCSFPAGAPYAAELARHGAAVGRLLAECGARGRYSVDFAATSDEQARWQVYGLEVNLRKGGTTHPYAVLRNLAPGRYDPDAGTWVAQDGRPRCYCASDNLVDPAWRGLPASRVIHAVRAAGLEFDRASGTGVVLHMLAGLAVDGRFGLTAVGRTVAEASSMMTATRAVVDDLARVSARRADGTAR